MNPFAMRCLMRRVMPMLLLGGAMAAATGQEMPTESPLLRAPTRVEWEALAQDLTPGVTAKGPRKAPTLADLLAVLHVSTAEELERLVGVLASTVFSLDRDYLHEGEPRFWIPQAPSRSLGPDDKAWPSIGRHSGYRERLDDRLMSLLRQAIQRLDRPLVPAGEASPGRVQWMSPSEGPSRAWIWPGPAVKDDVTRFRMESGQGRLRLPLMAPQYAELLAWSRQRGWGMHWQLDPVRTLSGSWTLRWQVTLQPGPDRLWLVTPQGLVPATARGVTVVEDGFGGCPATDWLELSVDGAQQATVWATVGLASPAWAQGVKVSRLAVPADARESDEAYRGELRLAWPEDRLPALQLAASRYDLEVLQAGPGDAPRAPKLAQQAKTGPGFWGHRVWLADSKPAPGASEPARHLLTAAGSPGCPPP